MRASRFNEELNGDLGKYIFGFLMPIDLCMARFVCKEWSKLVAPQKLTFEKDFCAFTEIHNTREYISEVENLIVFPNRLVSVWKTTDKITLVKEMGYSHTFLFYYRKIQKEPSFYELYKSCDTILDIELILLPTITFRRGYMWELFLCMVHNNHRSGLDWLFKKFPFLSEHKHTGDLNYPGRIILTFDDISLQGFTYLYNTKNMTASFWKASSDSFWRNSHLDANEIQSLIDFALLCNYIPDFACSKITPEQHDTIIPICGCEKVAIYKKRKQ